MLESFVYVKSIKEINSHVKVKFIVSLLLVINFCAVAYVASLQFWSVFPILKQNFNGVRLELWLKLSQTQSFGIRKIKSEAMYFQQNLKSLC